MSEVSKVTLQLLPLHGAQETILNSKARFRVVACGRRFGKTSLAVEELVGGALLGHKQAYFAPTIRNLADVWREVKDTLAPITAEVKEHDLYMQLVNGAVIEFWPLFNLSAQTVRGRKYHKVIIDEGAQIRELLKIWQYTIRPLLTDYEGRALFLSTPNGMDDFYTLYARGISGASGWASFNFPTSANPYIKLEEIEEARKDLTDRAFRQEFLAEFLTDGGEVFRGVTAVCSFPSLPPEPGERYVFGVDWGKSEDFTVISVMRCSDLRQVYLDRFNQIGWTLQQGRLQALYEQYRPAYILAESNSIGEVNIDVLRSEGLPIYGFQTTVRTKPQLIDTLALAIERNQVKLLDDEILRTELSAYRVERSGAGWVYSAPSGFHDDTVIATALSVIQALRNSGVFITFVPNAPLDEDETEQEGNLGYVQKRFKGFGIGGSYLRDFYHNRRRTSE